MTFSAIIRAAIVLPLVPRRHEAQSVSSALQWPPEMSPLRGHEFPGFLLSSGRCSGVLQFLLGPSRSGLLPLVWLCGKLISKFRNGRKKDMAKNRYNKMQGGMQGNAQYNRPSGGYQKNLYKQQMNTAVIKQPKGLDQKTFRNIAIAVGVVWVIASVLLIMKMKWWGLLISMLIGLAVVAGGYFFIQYKEKEIIKYYKQIGMSEEMYIKELRKRNVDKKQIDQVRKTWRKVDADPVVGNAKDPKGGKKK